MDDDRKDYFRGLFERLFSGLPFEQPGDDSVDGTIRIGRVKGEGVPFGLDPDELTEHVLIVGRPGSGKTTVIYLMMIQLFKEGVPFWAFDFKQDYRHLRSLRI